MVVVDFTDRQWAIIHKEAKRRHDKFAHIPSNYGTTRNYHNDLVGVAGEAAVHKYTDVPWTGYGNDQATDLLGLEVRTRTKPGGRLCIHDKEEADGIFVGQKFVLCWYNPDETVTIVGWTYYSQITRLGTRINGRTYIATSDLHETETLRLECQTT